MAAPSVSWIPPGERRHRCQAKRANVYANDAVRSPGTYRCEHRACLVVDGVRFCRKHAGAMLVGSLAGPEPCALPRLVGRVS